MPLQQFAPVAQKPPFAVQPVPTQVPLPQVPLQQVELAVHAAPVPEQPLCSTVHAPNKHDSLLLQIAQAWPSEPHAEVRFPIWHLCNSSQQPGQLDGPQGDPQSQAETEATDARSKPARRRPVLMG